MIHVASVINVSVEKKETLTAEEWSVDQQMLSKLKEQYKRERHRDTKSAAAGSAHLSDSTSFLLTDFINRITFN